MSDILRVEGINSKGFGIIPKMVMQDRRLSAQSKAIYSYFASYAGAGRTAFPSRGKITTDLDIGTKAYYKHFNLLKQYGYIEARQERASGKFVRNIYILSESIPCTQNDHTVPCTPFAHTPNAHTHDAHTQKNHINNNSIQNNQIENTSSSENTSPSSLSVPKARYHDVAGQDETDIAQKIKTYEELIKRNITYEDFRISYPHDMRLVDEIVSAIVDVMVSDSSHVRIDREDKPRELVKHVLMKLDYESVELVIAQFKGLTERVQRKRQYFITMLYNSHHELDAHYTNEVNTWR